MDYLTEFNRQVENLIEKDYPSLAGLTTEEFLNYLEPLKQELQHFVPSKPIETEGYLPFVLVIKSQWVTPEQAMEQVERKKQKGFVNLYPIESQKFVPLQSLALPDKPAYLLFDIDRGEATINITPETALKTITQEGRLPLTIDEGVAVLTHYPDFLKKNHCFSLLGSRCGDQRVPALWLSKNKPRLGWCWDRNPHTWLGSASCSKRAG